MLRLRSRSDSDWLLSADEAWTLKFVFSLLSGGVAACVLLLAGAPVSLALALGSATSAAVGAVRWWLSPRLSLRAGTFRWRHRGRSGSLDRDQVQRVQVKARMLREDETGRRMELELIAVPRSDQTDAADRRLLRHRFEVQREDDLDILHDLALLLSRADLPFPAEELTAATAVVTAPLPLPEWHRALPDGVWDALVARTRSGTDYAAALSPRASELLFLGAVVACTAWAIGLTGSLDVNGTVHRIVLGVTEAVTVLAGTTLVTRSGRRGRQKRQQVAPGLYLLADLVVHVRHHGAPIVIDRERVTGVSASRARDGAIVYWLKFEENGVERSLSLNDFAADPWMMKERIEGWLAQRGVSSKTA